VELYSVFHIVENKTIWKGQIRLGLFSLRNILTQQKSKGNLPLGLYHDGGVTLLVRPKFNTCGFDNPKGENRFVPFPPNIFAFEMNCILFLVLPTPI